MFSNALSRLIRKLPPSVRQNSRGEEPIFIKTNTPPELTSINEIMVSGRISRAPEWYEEGGKQLLAFGLRTTFSRMKKEIITENGIMKWSQYFIMGQLHRCVCGYKLLGSKRLDTNEIYENVAPGDLLLVRGALRYKKISDQFIGGSYLGTDVLVSSLFLITKGDGEFTEEMLYTESGTKVNLNQLNRGISKSEIFQYRG